MIEAVQQAMIASGIAAGFGIGVAAIIRAYFDGRATLLRAKRGDPEPERRRSLLLDLLRRRTDD